MRNLYKHLGIDPDATVNDIERAIDACGDDDLQRDANRVLLNLEAKEVYDRNLEVLTTIGKLRIAMNLTNTSNWDEDLRKEFCVSHAPLYRTIALAVVCLALSAAFVLYRTSDSQTASRAWAVLESRIEESARNSWDQSEEREGIVRDLRAFSKNYKETRAGALAENRLRDLRYEFVDRSLQLSDVQEVAHLFPKEGNDFRLLRRVEKFGRQTDSIDKLKEIIAYLVKFDANEDLVLAANDIKDDFADRQNHLESLLTPSDENEPDDIEFEEVMSLVPVQNNVVQIPPRPAPSPEVKGEFDDQPSKEEEDLLLTFDSNHSKWKKWDIEGETKIGKLVDIGPEEVLVYIPSLQSPVLLKREGLSEVNMASVDEVIAEKKVVHNRQVLKPLDSNSNLDFVPRNVGRYRFYFADRSLWMSPSNIDRDNLPIGMDWVSHRSSPLKFEGRFNYLVCWLAVGSIPSQELYPKINILVKHNNTSISKFCILIPSESFLDGGYLLVGHFIEPMIVTPGDHLEIKLSGQSDEALSILPNQYSHLELHQIGKDNKAIPRIPLTQYYLIN